MSYVMLLLNQTLPIIDQLARITSAKDGVLTNGELRFVKKQMQSMFDVTQEYREVVCDVDKALHSQGMGFMSRYNAQEDTIEELMDNARMEMILELGDHPDVDFSDICRDIEELHDILFSSTTQNNMIKFGAKVSLCSQRFQLICLRYKGRT